MIAVRSSDVSRELLRCCPTVEFPVVGMEFERLWLQKVDRPWFAGAENVLGLYGMNQVVAERAKGRQGEGYARQALANMARLKARWREIPDEVEWQALEHEAPEEVPWLELLINRGHSAELVSALTAWNPTNQPWSSVKNLLSEISLTGEKKLRFTRPPTTSHHGSSSHEVLSLVSDLSVERLGLSLPLRGAWKTIAQELKGETALYPQSFYLAAQLYDSKISKTSRKNIEEKLSHHLYYLRRLEHRLELRGWKRALGFQREIIALVTAKLERLRSR